MSDEIKEITEEEISESLKPLWQKSQNAFEMKNYTYVVSLCQAILKESPGFLDARRLARNAAASENAGKKKKKGLFGGGLSLRKISSTAKKDPLSALAELEVELAKEPFDGPGNDLMFECALSLNFLETAAFALETVRSGAPENVKLLHKLAEHYLARDMPDKAGDVYSDIVKQDPADIDAVKGAKDAIAKASMKKQKWEEAESFRDVMKDADDAAEQESANRAAMTKEQMLEKLEKVSAAYAADNQNLQLVKELGSLYEQLEDWPNAHSFFQYAYELSNKDVALENKATAMKDKASEQQLEALREASEADPGNTELKAEYDALVSERSASQVVDAQERVDRNPTDPHFRYELGVALYNVGNHSDAIPHLQQATRNPHIRTRVLLLLGRTFRAKNMPDLAIKQLTDALADLTAMDGTKKEILYEKGLIHAEMEDRAAALESFKQIYEVDYGYLDVAKRVEESY